jgi:phosphoglycolate phosphatase-like HAD superfamily hydrolase
MNSEKVFLSDLDDTLILSATIGVLLEEYLKKFSQNGTEAPLGYWDKLDQLELFNRFSRNPEAVSNAAVMLKMIAKLPRIRSVGIVTDSVLVRADLVLQMTQLGELADGLFSSQGPGWYRKDEVLVPWQSLDGYHSVSSDADRDELLKPNPSVYSLACETFEIAARNVVALENAPEGVSSAIAAGASCIGFISPFVPLDQHEAQTEELMDAGAFCVVRDLVEVPRIVQRWCIQ